MKLEPGRPAGPRPCPLSCHPLFPGLSPSPFSSCLSPFPLLLRAVPLPLRLLAVPPPPSPPGSPPTPSPPSLVAQACGLWGLCVLGALVFAGRGPACHCEGDKCPVVHREVGPWEGQETRKSLLTLRVSNRLFHDLILVRGEESKWLIENTIQGHLI